MSILMNELERASLEAASASVRSGPKSSAAVRANRLVDTLEAMIIERKSAPELLALARTYLDEMDLHPTVTDALDALERVLASHD